MNEVKRATPAHPIHDLLADRFSPYGFSDRELSDADLCSLFEAARWAASSFNEQPWRFIVARRGEEAFDRLLSCLVEANQGWARNAGALALGITRASFARNDKPNAHDRHDLGQAAANLATQATAMGLAIHQMAGLSTERAAEAFGVPKPFEVVTAIAIGYAVEPPESEPDRQKRDRKELDEFVFGDGWETRPGFLGRAD